MKKNIFWFKDISIKDVPLVGGKNASLGEMFSKLTKNGINVPDGFALTSNFYWAFIKENGLNKKLKNIFAGFKPKSIANLQKTGKAARIAISNAVISANLEKE
ncbi:MAG: PEP/pyruvate-binding domain-containing protein, partial [bacterium]|nr:PEP/pyruvate-binding domain-containing protein [bacterium]